MTGRNGYIPIIRNKLGHSDEKVDVAYDLTLISIIFLKFNDVNLF